LALAQIVEAKAGDGGKEAKRETKKRERANSAKSVKTICGTTSLAVIALDDFPLGELSDDLT
jgi:hypothetical protein